MTIMMHNEMFGYEEPDDQPFDDDPGDCPYHECDGTGFHAQPKELYRFYSPSKCRCNPTYNESTERMRAYS